MLLAWTFALGLALAPWAGCQQLSNWNTGVATFYVSEWLSLTDVHQLSCAQPSSLSTLQANWRTGGLHCASAGAGPVCPPTCFITVPTCTQPPLAQLLCAPDYCCSAA